MSVEFSIKSMLAAFSAANKRQFAHDRSLSVGGSEVGQCLRKTWLTKKGEAHGFERDDDASQSSGATDRGSVYEAEVWAPALHHHRPAGSKLLFAGDFQETLHDGLLSVTPDGLFVNLPRDCLAHLGISDIGGQFGNDDDDFGCLTAECKTKDPRVNLRGKPKAENEFQVHSQIGAIRAKTKYRPLFGVISYTNASFFDDVEEFAIGFDPAIYEAAKKRAAVVFDTYDPARLSPEGKIYGANDCNFCAFKTACAQISCGAIPPEPAIIPKLSPDIDARVEDLARQVATMRDAEEEASRGKNLASEQLKILLRDLQLPRVQTGMLSKVSWSAQSGRKSYNMDRLREDLTAKGIDIADYETTGAAFDRLNVTVYTADEVADKKEAEAAKAAARADLERERAEKAAEKEAERIAKEAAKAEKARLKAEDDAYLASLSPADRKQVKADRAKEKTLAEAGGLVSEREAEALAAGL